MAIAKWISFSQPVANVPDNPAPKPRPTPCTADGKRFGLENFGNTCYANSVLQALYFCAPFRELVIQHAILYPNTVSPHAPALPPGSPATRRRQDPRSPSPQHAASRPAIPPTSRSLFAALRALYVYISQNPADKGSVAPRPFIEKLRELNEGFRNTMHHDAHEFLNYLLNRMVEEMEEEKRHRLASGDDLPHSTSSSSSASQLQLMTASMSTSSTHSPGATFIHQIFEGVLTSETRCLTCENVSSRDESFLDLSIDIEQNSSVTACLKQFSASEMLCQKDKFFCDACCDLQEAERRMKIKRLPNVLALHLKRFKYQEDVQKYIKLTYRVAFPLELRLFNTVDDIPNPDRLYELFAIVVHIGNGPNHGHYVSIIKTMGTWLIFDDENVDSIKESDISRYFGDSNAGSAYVLYYQALDIDLSALGLRSPSPDPVVQPVPLSEPPQLWQSTDSPVSTARSIPLPPGLSDPPVPKPIPRSITPPTPKHPPEPLKSPRKASSQLLQSAAVRSSTAGQLARANTTLHVTRSAVDGKFNSAPKPSLQPVTILPTNDLKPSRGPASPVNGKERDADKSMMGWLRPFFKTVRSRPSSEINADKPSSQNSLAVLGSPVRNQSTSSSSNSSKDSRHPVDSPTSSHRSRISPLPNGKPIPRPRAADSSYETDSRHSSLSVNSNTISTPDRHSQARSLPSIPASPHVSVAETPLPASARTSLDHTRVPRRQARPSIREQGSRQLLKTPARPATSTGSPTQTHPPPLNGPLSSSSSPAPSSRVSVNRSDPGNNGRPKSAQNSYGFLMLPPGTATPPVPVSSTGTSVPRRTGRKLSLSAPMLGFKRREKDQ